MSAPLDPPHRSRAARTIVALLAALVAPVAPVAGVGAAPAACQDADGPHATPDDCGAHIADVREDFLGEEDKEQSPLLDELLGCESHLFGFLERGVAPQRAATFLVYLYWDFGRYRTALPHEERVLFLDEALAFARESGNPNAELTGQLYLAEYLADNGERERALNGLAAALSDPDFGRSTRPFALLGLAEIQRQEDDYRGALASLDLIEIPPTPAGAEVSPWQPVIRGRHGARGQIYIELGLTGLAAREVAAERALVAPMRADIDRNFADLIASDYHSVHLLLAQGRYRDAADFAAECLSSTELYDPRPEWRAGMELSRAEALASLAREGEGAPEPALELLRRALGQDLRPNHREQAVVHLAALLLYTDQPQAARELLTGAFAEGTVNGSERRPMEEEAVVTRLLLRLGLDEGATPEALSLLRDRLRTSIQTRLELWSEFDPRPGGIGFLRIPARREWLDEDTRASLVIQPGDAGVLAALDLWIAAQSLGTLARTRALRAGEAARAPEVSAGAAERARAQLLRPGEGMLVLLASHERSHLIALDGERALHAELPARRQLLAQLTELRSAISARGEDPGRADAEREAAARFSAVLLPEPLRTRLAGWHSVLAVGFELGGRIPLELLPLRDREWLGLERALTYLPSIPLGLRLAANWRTDAEGRGLSLVAAADPGDSARALWDDPLPVLDLSEARLAPLLAPYEARWTELRTGESAITAALRERLSAPGSRVLQLLAHGVLDHSLERPTKMLLSASGGETNELDCRTVDGFDAPELVVVTSCGAGLGRPRVGDDTSGDMGGAWIGAGASLVVLTDGRLSLENALQTSAGFHVALARGAPPAEALRAAHATLVEESGLDALYSGGWLYATGLGTRPLFPGPLSESRPAPPEASIAQPEVVDEPASTGTKWVVLLGGAAAALFVFGVVLRRAAR